MLVAGAGGGGEIKSVLSTNVVPAQLPAPGAVVGVRRPLLPRPRPWPPLLPRPRGPSLVAVTGVTGVTVTMDTLP